MFFPKRKQFSQWSVPSKWSYIGGILGVIGLFLAIYFGFCSRSNKAIQIEEMEVFANILLSSVLDGSPLCCDIKTGEIIVILPEEKMLLLNASMLIGFIPDNAEAINLSFSYSLNQKDSLNIFNCSDVGRKEIDIYFFKNRKLFCSKPAILDLRDPALFCGN